MRIKYNFAFKNSKLSPWQRPAPPNLLVTDASIDKKIVFLFQEFNKNAEVFYPSSLILIESAAGTLGKPGIVIISPQTTTINSAPEESLISLTGKT